MKTMFAEGLSAAVFSTVIIHYREVVSEYIILMFKLNPLTAFTMYFQEQLMALFQ
jgi:hypothetical protein